MKTSYQIYFLTFSTVIFSCEKSEKKDAKTSPPINVIQADKKSPEGKLIHTSNKAKNINQIIDERNYEEAHAQLKTLSPEIANVLRIGLLHELYKSWLQDDPKAALNALSEVEPEHMRRLLLIPSMEITLQHTKEAYHVAESIDAQISRSGFISQIYSNLFNKNPVSSHEFIINNFHMGMDRSDMLSMQYLDWYRQAPDEAIRYYKSLEYPEDKIAAEAGILSLEKNLTEEHLRHLKQNGFSKASLDKLSETLKQRNEAQ